MPHTIDSMATRVRSYSKINLGLAIGPMRTDGFHGLTTLYQTLDLHDLVTVTARMASGSATRISLTTNDARVPTDGRNTVWKMVERCLERLDLSAEVEIHIEKNLPVQGGMGAGSANAAAALIGLERELGVALSGVERLKLAAEVGSDVPLFLIGGAVMGLGRGEQVVPMADFPRTWCVVAVPEVGVSTPAAFRDWDALVAGTSGAKAPLSEGSSGTAEAMPLTRQEDKAGLTSVDKPDRLSELSLAYASLSAQSGISLGKTDDGKPGTSGIVRDANSEKKQGLSGESQSNAMNDLAENTLLALVRTGIGSDGLHNDFEDVVFPQYPSLRITKRQLMGNETGASGSPAIYAALSGSGSALFGLYRSEADAKAAQQRVQNSGVKAFITETLPRDEYWARMFAG
ncbi:MAG TPA: 4-(cytidine 5'-diphospho)-2-C-methyl-D-erythritol kinase [Edaphobacter sp.]|nr:4-(cytidine 5'-diphospho)-2-C-methyl-D-erythritol kinase [Edaphobacter sp.]